MSNCQICERNIKDSKGVIAHHGYKRPGSGWQSASCMGARHQSYAKSRDVIPIAIEYLRRWIANREDYLAKVKAGTVTLTNGHNPSSTYFREYEPSDLMYKNRQYVVAHNTESEIKNAQKDMTRLQARYDNWTPAAEVTV